MESITVKKINFQQWKMLVLTKFYHLFYQIIWKKIFVLETGDNLLKNQGSQLSKNVICHSDQVVHYTTQEYVRKLTNYNIKQFMSRRSNCWNNTPLERFFEHIKDEINITDCNTFAELKYCIDDCMDYYNNERYQWKLCKMTPNEYNKYIRREITLFQEMIR